MTKTRRIMLVVAVTLFVVIKTTCTVWFYTGPDLVFKAISVDCGPMRFHGSYDRLGPISAIACRLSIDSR